MDVNQVCGSGHPMSNYLLLVATRSWSYVLREPPRDAGLFAGGFGSFQLQVDPDGGFKCFQLPVVLDGGFEIFQLQLIRMVNSSVFRFKLS